VQLAGKLLEKSKICALLGYYASYNGNSFISGQPSGPIFKGQDIQEESRSHFGLWFIEGNVWAVIGYVSWEPITAHIFFVYKPQTKVWLAFFLDFFTLENGSDRLSQNIRKEVPLICCVIFHKGADLIHFVGEPRNLSWGVSLEVEVEVNSEIDFKKYVMTVSLTPLSQVLLGNLIFYYRFKKYADLCNMKTHYSLL
jgi:hypothetical protein